MLHRVVLVKLQGQLYLKRDSTMRLFFSGYCLKFSRAATMEDICKQDLLILNENAAFT